jgi:hypothetical protein
MKGALPGLHSIAATPDNKRVLVASGEGVVKIRDWERGFETGALRGENLAGQVDISRDGRFVAVGHDNRFSTDADAQQRERSHFDGSAPHFRQERFVLL